MSLPDWTILKEIIREHADKIYPGARFVEAPPLGIDGVDLMFVNEEGKPIFLAMIQDEPLKIPFMILDNLEWLKSNKHLFLRAYEREGILTIENPLFLFLASHYPARVGRAINRIDCAKVMLFQFRHVLFDGNLRIVFEGIDPETMQRIGSALVFSTHNGKSKSRTPSEFSSDLFSLFNSGVRGLARKIKVRGSKESIVFEHGSQFLAQANLAQSSFTVFFKDPATPPIVVHDPKTLEQALHEVIASFSKKRMAWREETIPFHKLGLTGHERMEIAKIWKNMKSHKKQGPVV